MQVRGPVLVARPALAEIRRIARAHFTARLLDLSVFYVCPTPLDRFVQHCHTAADATRVSHPFPLVTQHNSITSRAQSTRNSMYATARKIQFIHRTPLADDKQPARLPQHRHRRNRATGEPVQQPPNAICIRRRRRCRSNVPPPPTTHVWHVTIASTAVVTSCSVIINIGAVTNS